METTNKVEIEKNQGEIKITFNETIPGSVSWADLGLSDEDLVFDSGLVRMVFDFSRTNKERKFTHVPTIEVGYKENMGETHWICDYNGETILDKLDHHGHSSIMLMNRTKLESLNHHHENVLVMHAEFPEPVHILTANSSINFFN